MAQAEITETLPVSKDAFMNAVLAFEDYPKFVDGCKRVDVKRDGDTKATVTYFVNMMKEISYTLSHEADREAGRLTWTLVSSDFLKANKGYWEIRESGPSSCSVKYSIEIDFKFPVPGLILNRLVKGSLPAMLKGFASEAKKRG